MWCPFALTEHTNTSAIALQSTQPFWSMSRNNKSQNHHSPFFSTFFFKKKCPCSTLLFWLDKQHVGRPLRWLLPAFATGEVTASRSLRPRTKGKGITMWSVVVIETLWMLYFQNVLDQTLLWLLMIVVISISFLDKTCVSITVARAFHECSKIPLLQLKARKGSPAPVIQR